MESANILEVKGLCKKYPGFRLNNISFSLPRGYIMGFIGPNGAGKTTTIKAIMNLINIDDGEIRIMGQDHQAAEKTVKQKIGFVYDEPHFYEDLNSMEMARIIARFYQGWDRQVFQAYLQEFNIPVKKKIKELSRGTKTKLSLAIALAHQADLIIMDEPTSGLDPVFRHEILGILAGLIQDENKSVLFSTHITSDLEKVADYITFINKGQMVFTAPRDDILDRYVLVKGPVQLLNPEIKSLFIHTNCNNFGFEGLSIKAEELHRQLGDKVILERASLDDIMLHTVKGEE